MSWPVTLENDSLRLEVYPHFGGKVLSIVDKADEYELLFDYPAEFPTTCQYDQPYWSSYCAGWDECFPAVGPSPYPTHPYKGIGVPDHGELWSLATTAIPTKDGITTEWQGLRFGYRLWRNLQIDGPSIRAEYTLHNLAPFDFHFVWSMHALVSLHVPVELRLPGGQYRLSHDAEAQRIDATFTWPMLPGGDNLSVPSDLPSKRGWKIFSVQPISAPASIWYPTRKRKLTLEFSSASGLRAYWGLWVNTGGWSGHRHFAIEPTMGRFDELDRSVKDGSAGQSPGASRVNWQVSWTLGAD